MSYQYRITVTNVVSYYDDDNLKALDVYFETVLPEKAKLHVARIREYDAPNVKVKRNGNVQSCSVTLYQHIRSNRLEKGNADYVRVTIQRPEDGIHDVYLVGYLQLEGRELTTLASWFTWHFPIDLQLLEKDRTGKAVYLIPPK